MIKSNKRKIRKECTNLIFNDHKGITLVALIITIILMLILAGVTINIALNGGLFNVTKKAVKETEIAAYKEKIDAERINIIVEQISKGLSSKEFMDRYEEELRNNKNFEGVVITRKDDTTIEIITKEGYKFEITEEGTKYTENTNAPEEPKAPTNLNKSNTSFEYNIEGWTNQKVKVKIKVTGKIEGTLQYSRDGKSWTEYKGEEIEISDNNTSIYARVINSEGKAGTVWTGNIENIDKTPPTITLTQTNTTTKEYEKTISVTPSVGASGVSVMKYALGNQNAAYFANKGNDITGNSFTVSAQDFPTSSSIDISNSVYTVYLKNGVGTEIVKTIKVEKLLLDYTVANGRGLFAYPSGSKDDAGNIHVSGHNRVLFDMKNIPTGWYEISVAGGSLESAPIAASGYSDR